MSKFKLASIVFLLSTILLKFSSMIRDLVIAGFFGNSYMADVYFAAMTIPNTIVLFMLTGMKDAFLPSYFKYDKLGRGFAHLTNIVKGTFWVSLAISIVGIILTPLLMKWFYPDFASYEFGMKIAIWTSGVYFLSIALVGVNAVYEGYFDSQRKFSFSTFSQTIVVLTTILSTWIFHESLGIYAVPLGYLLGTVFSFLMKIVYLSPGRFMAWKQKMDFPEIKSFYQIFVPVGLTIAVGQVNLTINIIFAATLGSGVVSSLNYAFRLVNIPQAIFGVTIATIVYPILAQASSDKNSSLFKTGIEKGLSYMFLFLAPTVVGMIILMEPIVQVVYQRGAFDAAATHATSTYALFYMGSVLFYSIQAVIAKGFYTLEKGHYMMRIGLISIVINIISNYFLSQIYGPIGLAASASIVGFIYSAITFSTLYKISGGFSLPFIGKEYTKIIGATAVMAASLWYIGKIEWIQNLHNIPFLIIMIILGAGLYFAVLYALRTSSFIELLAKGRKAKKVI
ncbi:murein biosynthesis integral membrane protein MurJ [Peribacillus loiseleuriae]|uniref:murein biosynthesis integral membrane protein MurJ n=1 Tax=Peribacillus loiseleuriae TaxID=1679170 RepID=UPI003CFD3198